MHSQKTSVERQIAYIVRLRNRERLWKRLSNGLHELNKHRWKLAPLVVLIVLALLAWSNRGRVALTSPIPLFSEIWAYTVDALIVLLTLIALLMVLAALGTPYQAKRIEEALKHVGVVDRYGFPPILLSRQRDKSSGITTMTFYSRGISKELWEKKRQKIEEVLNMHQIEDVKYGGKHNGNYIILTVAKGTERIERSETLYDDEP